MEFNPNFCQNQTFFPYDFKNRRVPWTLAHQAFACRCCPVQCAYMLGPLPPQSHPASGIPWPQDSNLRRVLPGSLHLLSALLSVTTEQHGVTLCTRKSPLQAWLRGPQIRFIRQDKITIGWGTAEPGSREIFSGSCSAREMLTVP